MTAVRCPHCGDLFTSQCANFHIETCRAGCAQVSTPPDFEIQVVDNVIKQLDWRGPSGKKLGYVVLTRGQVCALIGYKDKGV